MPVPSSSTPTVEGESRSNLKPKIRAPPPPPQRGFTNHDWKIIGTTEVSMEDEMTDCREYFDGTRNFKCRGRSGGWSSPGGVGSSFLQYGEVAAPRKSWLRGELHNFVAL
ncbi:unnamed protein product [Arabis nemorensis]|uniref:Uncharacterized protein n=1 Tax=Arabis nemorensis TaxID=586526 RepID=A0A565BG48_9BRAS|nr:unnamed protein product [Arabis nemorensis]